MTNLNLTINLHNTMCCCPFMPKWMTISSCSELLTWRFYAYVITNYQNFKEVVYHKVDHFFFFAQATIK